jgi:hypoxia up-regulated 1
MFVNTVTNFQSKRKTPTSISFYKNERLFGSDSIALQGRKPEVTYSKMYRAIGKVAGHHHIDEIIKEQYFPHNIYTNETTGFTHVAHEDSSFTPEELIAMMMQHAKDMVASFGGKPVRDCVMTVPSYFTQHERRALYTAANIADLNVLSLIEENTAAALHYGVDRVFEEPSTALFYNFGAGSIQATVVTYSSFVTKEAGKNKTVGQFEVVGKAWDASLGGFSFDVKLANLLATRFNAMWNKKASGAGKDVREFVRPMTRLRIESTKIKEILSANAEYPVKFEQLHADLDLSTKVTRAEFEAACADLFERMTKPIDEALRMANMSLQDVKTVELLGGGVRMPKVKKVLEDYFKVANLELGQHMNGDESMALGAAFRGANLSTSFRVRKVGMSDISSFGVTVALDTLPVEESKPGLFASLVSSVLGSSEKAATEASAGTTVEGEAIPEVWSKSVELFPRKSVIPSKTKTLTFPYDKDILCRVMLTENEHLPRDTGTLLAMYNITGVADFSKETAAKYPNASAPKVHISFAIGDDGVVNLIRAEISAELPMELPDADAGKIEAEGDASVNATATSEAAEATNESNTTASEEGSEGSNSTATDANATSTGKDKKKASKKADTKEAKQKKDNTLRKSLKIIENYDVVKPGVWSQAHIAAARTRLLAMDAADNARKAREAALNDLEAYIYQVKNKLTDDEDNWKKVSTEEQRQEVVDLASAAEEWIYDDGRNAVVSEYKAKQDEIKKKAEQIFRRFSEMTDRPKAVEKAHNMIRTVKSKIETWKLPESHITEKEIDSLQAAIKKVEEWLESKQEKQLSLAAHEKPAFDSSDVKSTLEPLTTLYKKLSSKPVPEKKVLLDHSIKYNRNQLTFI